MTLTISKRISTALSIVTLMVLAAPVSLGQVAPATLEPMVQRLIEQAQLPGATVTCSVVELRHGTPWVDIGADRMMIPASNQKLLTSGAALHVLGPNFRFETKFVRAGNSLVLVGDGDPALADPELLPSMQIEVETLLDRWISELPDALDGPVDRFVVDDRIFDNTLVEPSWEAGDLMYAYGAPVSGFNFFGNCINFYAWPSKQLGSAPVVRIEPNVKPWLDFRNNAKTRNVKGEPNGIYLRREPGNAFVMGGPLNRAQAVPIRITIDDPADFYAQHFASLLEARGVRVGSFGSATLDDPMPFVGQVVGTPIVTPIATVLERCNTDSENLYAEALFKRVGHSVTDQPGSWENGRTVLRMLVSRHLGPNMAMSMRIVDGSGLSRGNQVSADVLTAWLAHMYRQEALRDAYVDSLGIPGQTGTMRKRFQDGALTNKVRAKSGYISGVSCLSGYVISESGMGVAFSIMCNDVPSGSVTRAAKPLQEAIVRLLDEAVSDKFPLTAEVDEDWVRPKLGG